ncbi:MAG: hypothetical protein GWM89_10885 [Candidatus Dadabacteria bacterium]|nr:DM13 domain-containing protein [Candidatus Dadabacteria bacterium]NIY22898.1 hypothetical protein [Candidatus Dadabacteria bacterium]
MNKQIIGIVLLIIVIVGWYLFRPEKLIIDSKVNEDFPAIKGEQANKNNAKPRVLLTGNFHEVAHPASGTAAIYKLPDGKLILRFTDFKVSNGPDVVVYLSVLNDSNDNDSIKNSGFISLGSMKGNVGDQNYELPDNLDINEYKSVVIWCKRFGVNFAVAPLKPG